MGFTSETPRRFKKTSGGILFFCLRELKFRLGVWNYHADATKCSPKKIKWEFRCHGCQHIPNILIFNHFPWQPSIKLLVIGCQKRAWQPMTTEKQVGRQNNSLILKELIYCWQPWQRNFKVFWFLFFPEIWLIKDYRYICSNSVRNTFGLNVSV